MRTVKSFMNTGFTLVELLIAVTIVGVLSATGLSLYQGARTTAQDAKRKADIDAIAKAFESAYNVKTGTYRDLTPADFSSGAIPVQPDGTNYPTCSSTACTVPDNKYYSLSIALSNGQIYQKNSSSNPIPTPTPIPYPQTINLANGWTTFGLTINKGSYMASQLYNDLGGRASGIQIAASLHSTTSEFWTDFYCPDGCTQPGAVSTDFPILIGQGYNIKSTQTNSITLVGGQATQTTLSLRQDWNGISFVRVPPSIASSATPVVALGNSIIGQGGNLVQISIYNGGWVSWRPGFSFNNTLPVGAGVAIFINMGAPFVYNIPSN